MLAVSQKESTNTSICLPDYGFYIYNNNYYFYY